MAIELIDFVCPLTWLERWARARAGMAPMAADGFIDHYLTGVVYPASAANLVLGLALLTVVCSWVLFFVVRRRRVWSQTDRRWDSPGCRGAGGNLDDRRRSRRRRHPGIRADAASAPPMTALNSTVDAGGGAFNLAANLFGNANAVDGVPNSIAVSALGTGNSASISGVTATVSKRPERVPEFGF